MKTEPNESITPIILRKIGETEFRVASIKDQNQGDYLHSSQGLTKREHFTGIALQGLLSNPAITPEASMSVNHFSEIAQDSVMIADYLITALNSQP